MPRRETHFRSKQISYMHEVKDKFQADKQEQKTFIQKFGYDAYLYAETYKTKTVNGQEESDHHHGSVETKEPQAEAETFASKQPDDLSGQLWGSSERQSEREEEQLISEKDSNSTKQDITILMRDITDSMKSMFIGNFKGNSKKKVIDDCKLLLEKTSTTIANAEQKDESRLYDLQKDLKGFRDDMKRHIEYQTYIYNNLPLLVNNLKELESSFKKSFGSALEGFYKYYHSDHPDYEFTYEELNEYGQTCIDTIKDFGGKIDAFYTKLSDFRDYTFDQDIDMLMMYYDDNPRNHTLPRSIGKIIDTFERLKYYPNSINKLPNEINHEINFILDRFNYSQNTFTCMLENFQSKIS